MRGLADQFRLLFNQRAELVKGVKRQKLNAAAAVDLRPAQLRFRPAAALSTVTMTALSTRTT